MKTATLYLTKGKVKLGRWFLSFFCGCYSVGKHLLRDELFPACLCVQKKIGQYFLQRVVRVWEEDKLFPVTSVTRFSSAWWDRSAPAKLLLKVLMRLHEGHERFFLLVSRYLPDGLDWWGNRDVPKQMLNFVRWEMCHLWVSWKKLIIIIIKAHCTIITIANVFHIYFLRVRVQCNTSI